MGLLGSCVFTGLTGLCNSHTSKTQCGEAQSRASTRGLTGNGKRMKTGTRKRQLEGLPPSSPMISQHSRLNKQGRCEKGAAHLTGTTRYWWRRRACAAVGLLSCQALDQQCPCQWAGEASLKRATGLVSAVPNGCSCVVKWPVLQVQWQERC